MKQSLVECVAAHASLHPHQLAVVCQGETLSFGALYALTESYASFLMQQGVQSGDVVVVRSSQSADFLITYLAIHRLGAVAAPLEKDITPSSLATIVQHLASRWVIADPDLDTDCRFDFRRIRQDGQPYTVPLSLPFPASSMLADILFTTGTTGRTKGVMRTHQAWMADADDLTRALGFTSDLMFITTGPINHIGNLSKVYPTWAQGAGLFLMEGMKSLEDFYTALDYGSAPKAAFLVPASIRMLMQLSGDRLSAYAGRIRFIETGAAPISQSDMQQLAGLLPHSRLFNTYASSETGIMCTYNFNDGISRASCVGHPMHHVRLFITDHNRQPVTTPGTIGLIACQGPTLMTGYANDPELTATILSEQTLYTSDLGYINPDGQLILTGRESDIINVGGLKVSPIEVEDVAMAIPGIKECICIAQPHKVMGQALKLLVVMSEGHTFDRRALISHFKQHLENYKIPLMYEEVDSIRRTYNGKIDRKAYL